MGSLVEGLYRPASFDSPLGLRTCSGLKALRPQPAAQSCSASWHVRACVASAAASAGQVQAAGPAKIRSSLPNLSQTGHCHENGNTGNLRTGDKLILADGLDLSPNVNPLIEIGRI